MSTRYAIYFTPTSGTPWWNFGAHWLGRDERTNQALVQPALVELPAQQLLQLTAYPRRYGFHATLKAPFTLRDGVTEAELLARMRALAQQLKPVALGPMVATRLDNFTAVLPRTAPAALGTLAARCVTSLDDLRAPLSQQDLARRLAQNLDARQQELLMQYGYPHVLERYQLHFTLTGPIAEPLSQVVVRAVEGAVARLNQEHPLVLDRLCLFVESEPGASFLRVADAELLA
jgi:putative phosphonate metabolism protein